MRWRHDVYRAGNETCFRINCLLAEVSHVILSSNRYDRVDKYPVYWIPGCRYTVQWFNSTVARAFCGTIPGSVVDFWLLHEPYRSEPNPQSANIKSGYMGRESRTNRCSPVCTSKCHSKFQVSIHEQHAKTCIVQWLLQWLNASCILIEDEVPRVARNVVLIKITRV